MKCTRFRDFIALFCARRGCDRMLCRALWLPPIWYHAAFCAVVSCRFNAMLALTLSSATKGGLHICMYRAIDTRGMRYNYFPSLYDTFCHRTARDRTIGTEANALNASQLLNHRHPHTQDGLSVGRLVGRLVCCHHRAAPCLRLITLMTSGQLVSRAEPE